MIPLGKPQVQWLTGDIDHPIMIDTILSVIQDSVNKYGFALLFFSPDSYSENGLEAVCMCVKERLNELFDGKNRVSIQGDQTLCVTDNNRFFDENIGI